MNSEGSIDYVGHRNAHIILKGNHKSGFVARLSCFIPELQYIIVV